MIWFVWIGLLASMLLNFWLHHEWGIALRDNSRLLDIVHRFPKNADGDSVAPGDVQCIESYGVVKEIVEWVSAHDIRGSTVIPLSDCHSTPETARKRWANYGS